MADYAKQWRRYKWIRNAFIVAVIVWALPLGFTGIQLAIFLAWTAIVSVLTAMLVRWKCPRCGEIFSGGRKHWILLPPKCVSCGLPKFATDPTAGSTEQDDPAA